MDHHSIYMYMLTFASFHSHKDVNTLHTTHNYVYIRHHQYTYTHTTIFARIIATFTYMYMIKQYQTPSDIIHIPTVHNISVLAYIIK